MPVPVKHKCKKCHGEADLSNVLCIPCAYTDFVNFDNFKHVPSSYFYQEKKDEKK